MEELVKARRTAEVKEERHDLMAGLLEANEGVDSGAALTDEEVMGTCPQGVMGYAACSFE